MITPLDIENKKFNKQMMNGYNVDEVDEFLDQVMQDYETNYKEFVSKFKIKMTDEEAGNYLRERIQQCVSAFFPVAMDYVHKFVQNIRT